MAAADLAVSRAGAGTLGEFPIFGLPAILVPYPHVWRFQKVNADYLVSAGAAERLDDATLSADLLPAVRRLLKDATMLETMAAQASMLATPDAAARVAAEVRAIVLES